jgi:hypothetical protein
MAVQLTRVRRAKIEIAKRQPDPQPDLVSALANVATRGVLIGAATGVVFACGTGAVAVSVPTVGVIAIGAALLSFAD